MYLQVESGVIALLGLGETWRGGYSSIVKGGGVTALYLAGDIAVWDVKMKSAISCELFEEFVCKNICYVSIIFTSDDWWLESRMSVL